MPLLFRVLAGFDGEKPAGVLSSLNSLSYGSYPRSDNEGTGGSEEKSGEQTTEADVAHFFVITIFTRIEMGSSPIAANPVVSLG